MNTNYINQKAVTQLCMRTALLLLQHGMESAVVVQLTKRLGFALGMESVECSLSSNAIIVATSYQNNCLSSVKNCEFQNINMDMISEVQHIVINCEQNQLNFEEVYQQLHNIQTYHYPSWLVVLIIGLSCACFSHLAGGDEIIFEITFLASSIAMWVRQQLVSKHYNPIIVFSITAFMATLIAGQAWIYDLGNDPQIALASSVLLLVPGFPLVNSLADILKGHINMGIARWVLGAVLTFGACLGILLAIGLLGINKWG